MILMLNTIKSQAMIVCLLLFLAAVSTAGAKIPNQLRVENIGLNQTISINLKADKETPGTLSGIYKVLSHESESPLISIQFTAKATESLNVLDCYALVVQFSNNIIPYHQPKDIETTKWSLCLEAKGQGTKWRLKFPIVGKDYTINDVTVNELELEQVTTSHKDK
jgi:hypothetical protein